MNFRRRKRDKVEISMTPMIDAVLFLLFFFIMASSFTRETELKITLPEASGAEQSGTSKKLTLAISANGEYSLISDDEEVQVLAEQNTQGLQKALQNISEAEREKPLVISADAKTPHQAVISALDVAGQLGFTHITFAAKQPEAAQAE